MGLEIVGSRMLAPYFGNSVFVWGSLISLFLIALSRGLLHRRAAGRSAAVAGAAQLDRDRGGGVDVCGRRHWRTRVRARSCAQGFGEKSGPFLASRVLFLLPSIGMGMVSPFAVRLATHTVASVGKTAGTLYALSTLGSIAGTMLTTFVLIPWIGAGTILKGLATALLATAVVTFPFGSRGGGGARRRAWRSRRRRCGCTAYAVNPARASAAGQHELCVDVDTPYHHISVVDQADGDVRELRFDRYIESAIELAAAVSRA